MLSDWYDLSGCYGHVCPGDLVRINARGIWVDPERALHEPPNFVQQSSALAIVIAVSDHVWVESTAALILLSTGIGWVSTKMKK